MNCAHGYGMICPTCRPDLLERVGGRLMLRDGVTHEQANQACYESLDLRDRLRWLHAEDKQDELITYERDTRT